ncbi:hypothetical protein OAL11_00265 [bacterium]|nr:hypothetical protein [bacterium]
MLSTSSSAKPKLTFDRLILRCDKSDHSIVNKFPWDWSICAGERLSIMSSNSFLKYQMMAILSGFVHPVSGDIDTFASLSWPLGGEGGLDSKLTIDKGLEFLSSIYSDCLDASLVSVDEFFEVLQTRSILSSMRIKDLSREQKDFFYMALSILFLFDIYLVPRSKYLMTKDARPLRQLFHKQLSDTKSLVSVTVNNRFRREFCNRGLVLGPLGEILFHGDLEEAIAYERQNVKIGSESESEEDQFDIANHLTNSDSKSDQSDDF